MKLSEKLANHFGYNYAGTAIKTARLAGEAARNLGPVAKGVASAGGMVVGSILGGINIWSPVAIVETFVRSDESLEKRIQEVFDSDLD